MTRNAPAQLFLFDQGLYQPYSSPTLDGSVGDLQQVIDIHVDPVTVDVVNVGTTTQVSSDHPGGLGVVGEIVSVPIEGWVGEVIFYRPEANDEFQLEELSRLQLGVQGEAGQGDLVTRIEIYLDQNNLPQQGALRGRRYAAGSVALTRLSSGRYLLFVTGTNNGVGGGWFYLSDQTEIDTYTTWKYLDDWQPNCASYPPTIGCWGGADNAVILNQCDGQLFVLGLAGPESLVGNPPSHVSVRRIVQSAGSADIELDHVATFVVTGSNAPTAGDPRLRYGASATVTSNGAVVMEMTERDIDGGGSNTSIQVAKFRPPL